MSDLRFENNYADYDGGAIRQNRDSKLDIVDSQFINNTAKIYITCAAILHTKRKIVMMVIFHELYCLMIKKESHIRRFL